MLTSENPLSPQASLSRCELVHFCKKILQKHSNQRKAHVETSRRWKRFMKMLVHKGLVAEFSNDVIPLRALRQRNRSALLIVNLLVLSSVCALSINFSLPYMLLNGSFLACVLSETVTSKPLDVLKGQLTKGPFTFFLTFFFVFLFFLKMIFTIFFAFFKDRTNRLQSSPVRFIICVFTLFWVWASEEMLWHKKIAW